MSEPKCGTCARCPCEAWYRKISRVDRCSYPVSTISNNYCRNFNSFHSARLLDQYFYRMWVNVHTRQFEIVLTGYEHLSTLDIFLYHASQGHRAHVPHLGSDILAKRRYLRALLHSLRQHSWLSHWRDAGRGLHEFRCTWLGNACNRNECVRQHVVHVL